MKRFFTLSFVLFSYLSTSQYCTSVGPSTTADSNLQTFNITGESASTISYSGCPGVVGLDDETGTTLLILNAGSAYSATAQFGTCGGNYAGVGQGWIDFNQNQVFETTESIGTWSGIPPTAASIWNFNVPAGASNGTTRMRIMHHEGGTLPADPCASFVWGSVTDFTVQIGGGIDCSSYTGQTISNPRIISSLPYSENYSNAVCYFNNFPVYNSPDVFYQIIPSQLSLTWTTVSLCGSTIDTYLSILDKDGNVLFFNDDNCGTASKIHFNSSGYDTLYAVVQGYGSQSGNYTINVDLELANIHDSYGLNAVTIYPNPVVSELTIKNMKEPFSFEVYDLSGKKVLEGIEQMNEVIDLSFLEPGIYSINLFTLNESKVIQFIKY